MQPVPHRLAKPLGESGPPADAEPSWARIDAALVRAVSSLGAGRPGRPAREERRAWVRHGSGHSASCEPASGEGDRDPARILDVSAGGLGLLMRCSFPAGTPLTVSLEHAGSQAAREYAVQVIHARPLSRTCWLVGCTFARPLTEDELQALAL